MLSAGTAFGAAFGTQSYKNAYTVSVTLGQSDLAEGLRLVEGEKDGNTQPSTEYGGRQSLPNAGGLERYFYFDVHDSFINGGQNKVAISVVYVDLGLTPIYIEYDAYDPLRPEARTEDLTKKRVLVVNRKNTQAVKTETIELEDARFLGTQAGGADFRIYSSDELVLWNVLVWRKAHVDPPKPVRVVLDGEPVVFDPNEVQPFIQNGRTLVPMRALFNALGVSNDDILWNNETRTVEAKKGKVTLSLTIDDATVKVNGQPLVEPLDQPATVVAGRTVVPLRFVATQFGLSVGFAETQTERVVTLTTIPPELVPPTPGTVPTTPGTVPTTPGTVPTTPGTVPTTPGTVPTTPGTEPTQPTPQPKP
jgi:hypothetical protein